MSDFDKEAEREKLREKYGDDEDRETAEKMSELLLQGATMTNAHCSECGDPIFRYDGQEFCATCERAVERDAGDDSDAETDGPSDTAAGSEGSDPTDSASEIEVTSPSDTGVAFGDRPDEESDASEPSPDRSPPESDRPTSDTDRSLTESDRPADRSAVHRDSTHRGSVRRDSAPDSDPADVSEARAALVRTLTRFAERAEATDDPARAADHLAAAREAAEALAALGR